MRMYISIADNLKYASWLDAGSGSKKGSHKAVALSYFDNFLRQMHKVDRVAYPIDEYYSHPFIDASVPKVAHILIKFVKYLKDYSQIEKMDTILQYLSKVKKEIKRNDVKRKLFTDDEWYKLIWSQFYSTASASSSDSQTVLSLDQIAFNLLNSPYYCEPECIEMFSCYTADLEKGKLLQVFFDVVMKVLPMLSATCYGAERIVIMAHELDSGIINDFKAIFSLSAEVIVLVVNDQDLKSITFVESHFSRLEVHSSIELLQELLFQYTRMYPSSSVLQYFEGSCETVYVCILANSQDEKQSVLRKIQSIVERIPGSEKGANIDFILEHFTCLVYSKFNEKCGEHGQIRNFYKNEAEESQRGDFVRSSEQIKCESSPTSSHLYVDKEFR